MLTVACVFVKGNVPFTWDYVTKLKSMVQRSLPRRHRFVCFTDQPELEVFKQRNIETIETVPYEGIPGWWSKLEVFNASKHIKHGIEGPVLYLDLDVLVVRSLAPVVDFDARITFVPHAGTWEGRDGLAVVKRFNSSIMMIRDIEAHQYLYHDWNPDVARRLWGDQDWIGEQIKEDVRMMPLEWFPRLSEIPIRRRAVIDAEIPEEAKVVLCKKPKNHDAAKQWRWFAQRWQ